MVLASAAQRSVNEERQQGFHDRVEAAPSETDARANPPSDRRTGGEAHASFTGQTTKEQRWFRLAAKTPVLAASVRHAANKIYSAVAAGRAEITITPQAWLAARVAGLAPETTQYLASLAHRLLLPAPATSDQFDLNFTLKVATYKNFYVEPKTKQT